MRQNLNRLLSNPQFYYEIMDKISISHSISMKMQYVHIKYIFDGKGEQANSKKADFSDSSFCLEIRRSKIQFWICYVVMMMMMNRLLFTRLRFSLI